MLGKKNLKQEGTTDFSLTHLDERSMSTLLIEKERIDAAYMLLDCSSSYFSERGKPIAVLVQMNPSNG